MQLSPFYTSLRLLVGVGAAALTASAATAEPAKPAGLDTCLSAVNSLGASTGHTEIKDAQGRVAFRFTLRTSGMDYMATCDAQSGIVSDIAPRQFGTTAPM